VATSVGNGKEVVAERAEPSDLCLLAKMDVVSVEGVLASPLFADHALVVLLFVVISRECVFTITAASLLIRVIALLCSFFCIEFDGTLQGLRNPFFFSCRAQDFRVLGNCQRELGGELEKCIGEELRICGLQP